MATPRQTSDVNARLRTNVRRFYGYLASVTMAAAAPILASRLAEHGTPISRVLAVIVGTCGWLPVMFMTSLIIRMADEFTRRIHLVSIAFAFAAGLMLISLLDWLSRAAFMAPPPLSVVWVAIAMLWVLSLIVTKRRYERQS